MPFRDKFLVMLTPSNIVDTVGVPPEVVSEHFENTPRGQITEFRLYTAYLGVSRPATTVVSSTADTSLRQRKPSAPASIPRVHIVPAALVQAGQRPSAGARKLLRSMQSVPCFADIRKYAHPP
eukprot:m.381098 g.381098  ORF g.381098 m.381098 type:complete len:123 (-) comp20965_c4_seq12:346-714(-)